MAGILTWIYEAKHEGKTNLPEFLINNFKCILNCPHFGQKVWWINIYSFGKQNSSHQQCIEYFAISSVKMIIKHSLSNDFLLNQR